MEGQRSPIKVNKPLKHSLRLFLLEVISNSAKGGIRAAVLCQCRSVTSSLVKNKSSVQSYIELTGGRSLHFNCLALRMQCENNFRVSMEVTMQCYHAIIKTI